MHIHLYNLASSSSSSSFSSVSYSFKFLTSFYNRTFVSAFSVFINAPSAFDGIAAGSELENAPCTYVHMYASV